jgi:hypothetical protein
MTAAATPVIRSEKLSTTRHEAQPSTRATVSTLLGPALTRALGMQAALSPTAGAREGWADSF